MVDIFVRRSFPGPVGSVVLQGEEERLGALAGDHFEGTLREEVGQVAFFFGWLQVFVEVEDSRDVLVGEVVGGGAVDAEEFVEAVAVGSELRDVAEVPFAMRVVS